MPCGNGLGDSQDGATPGTQSYTERFAYADGFGRTVASFSKADPTAGDVAP